MSNHFFTARPGLGRVSGLEVALSVRVERRPSQRAIFAGASDLSVQQLTSELMEAVSRLRVYGYGLRGQLEQLVCALQSNVECGSWLYAQRAALDLAAVLTRAQKRGWLSGSWGVQKANCALRIAELCEREAR